MRRYLVLAGAVGILLIAGAAYVRWTPAPKGILGEVVGITRRVPVDGRFCGYVVRPTPVGEWPNGEAVCVWYRHESARRTAERDELKFHLFSRNVRHAQRSWEPLSEAAFRADLDSVHAALQRRGGTRVPCVGTLSPSTTEREYWRFPGFGVSVSSGGSVAPRCTTCQPEQRWSVFLWASRENTLGC